MRRYQPYWTCGDDLLALHRRYLEDQVLVRTRPSLKIYTVAISTINSLSCYSLADIDSVIYHSITDHKNCLIRLTVHFRH